MWLNFVKELYVIFREMLIYGEFYGEPAQLCDAGQRKSTG
jgi:hypothetical protein